jgi:hypothetical protein
LASLLNEIRALSDGEFAAVLHEAEEVATLPAKLPKRQPSKRPKDSPITRIAKVLRETRGLSDRDAQLWLRSALQRDGVDAARIPAVVDASLEAWLETLLKTVRSVDAYAVARSG